MKRAASARDVAVWPAVNAFPPTQRYDLVRTLGVGGMGAVFEAHDAVTGAHVALKTILEPDADALLRFKREFRIAADMHHPHLVRLYDLVAEGKHWFFTMELVRGGNVVDVLRPHGVQHVDEHATTLVRRSAPVESVTVDVVAVRRAAAQIADALDFLHQRGVVHRDIKPHNIAIDDVGNVRVMDFGLANRRASDLRISESNVVVGTLAYLAPELLAGQQATAASDLYALGIILFQVLTGRMPQAQAGAELPPVNSLVDVDGALGQLVDALLSRQPAQRPTAAAVRAALGAVARGSTERSDIFVGRTREREQLHTLVEHVHSGGAGAAWIVGPSGIGKSALAERVVADAVSRGFCTFVGRCYERERVPLMAFDRIVDAIVLALREWSLVEMSAVMPHLRRLAPTFPVIELLVSAGNSAGTRHPREQRQTIIDSLVELASALARRQPTLFVVDDLHWADEEGLVVLEALVARRIPGLLLIGLMRSTASPRLSALVANTNTVCCELHGLDLDELAALGRAAGVDDVSWTNAALTEGNGNPLLARHWAACAASADASTLTASAVLRAAFVGVSAEATRLLNILSAAGGDLPLHLLAEVSGLAATAHEAALGELMAQRLVVRVPGDVPRVDFSHDRWREVAYAALADDDKRALHALLAVALEKLTAPTLRDIEALLRHWGVAGDVTKRRAFTRQAADRALKQAMWRRTAELLRSLLLDADGADDDDDRGPAAWERVGDLFEWSGSHVDAHDAYSRAFNLLADDDRSVDVRGRRLRLLSRLAEHALALGDTITAMARCREGLAMLSLPLQRSLSSRLLHLAMLSTRLRVARRRRYRVRQAVTDRDLWRVEEMRFLRACVRIFFFTSQLGAAECYLRASLLALSVGDADGILRTLMGSAVMAMFRAPQTPAQVAVLRRQLDDAEAFAVAHGLSEGLAFVQHNRAAVWLASDLDRARTASDASLAQYRQLGLADTLDGTAIRVMHVVVLGLRGDDDDLRREVDDAVRSGNYTRACSASTSLAAHEYHHGDIEGLTHTVERFRRLAGHDRTSQIFVDLHLAELQLLVVRGDATQALAYAATHEPTLRAAGVHLQGMLFTLWNIAAVEAALLLAEARQLSSRERQQAEQRARWLTRHGVLSFSAFGQRARAILANVDGDSAVARRLMLQLLHDTASSCSPAIRSSCVEAACALGLASEEVRAEATMLRERYGYARPRLSSRLALAAHHSGAG
jgi:hypothetical protein